MNIAEFSNINGSRDDAVKEMDDLFALVFKNSLLRAPWDEGICKVCGMDKDDDKVLLCDKCDSEYHRYCLNPPLLKIPKGNWYCPSCVAGQSIPWSDAYGSAATPCRKRKRKHGEFTRKFLEDLAQLASLMELKECWDFTVEDRLFLMKLLFEEALNPAPIRDHMDQCASRTADLQQKLRSITSELKILKFKEEMLVRSTEKANSGVCNERRYMKTDASSYLFTVDNSSSKIPLVRYQSEQENIFALAQLPQGPSWPGYNFSGSTVNCVSEHAHPTPVSSIHESCGNHFSNQADIISQENSLKLVSIKKDICDLQDSIASIASEPLKVSLRKDFLGRDSSGRVYWAFYWPGARPWILANGSLTSQERASKEFAGIAESDKWMSYESDNEIEELLGWLRESNEREKELRESILQLQSSKLKAENHVLSKGESNHLMFSLPRCVPEPDFQSESGGENVQIFHSDH